MIAEQATQINWTVVSAVVVAVVGGYFTVKSRSVDAEAKNLESLINGQGNRIATLERKTRELETRLDELRSENWTLRRLLRMAMEYLAAWERWSVHPVAASRPRQDLSEIRAVLDPRPRDTVDDGGGDG